MTGYLLDSTVLIDVARGHEPVSTWLITTAQQGMSIFVSAITVSEYMSGVPGNRRAQALGLLQAYPLLNIDLDAAAQAGEYRFNQARKGMAISIPDALQAALATRHDLILATSNVSHFPGIRLVDPRSSGKDGDQP